MTSFREGKQPIGSSSGFVGPQCIFLFLPFDFSKVQGRCSRRSAMRKRADYFFLVRVSREDSQPLRCIAAAGIVNIPKHTRQELHGLAYREPVPGLF